MPRKKKVPPVVQRPKYMDPALELVADQFWDLFWHSADLRDKAEVLRKKYERKGSKHNSPEALEFCTHGVKEHIEHMALIEFVRDNADDLLRYMVVMQRVATEGAEEALEED